MMAILVAQTLAWPAFATNAPALDGAMAATGNGSTVADGDPRSTRSIVRGDQRRDLEACSAATGARVGCRF